MRRLDTPLFRQGLTNFQPLRRARSMRWAAPAFAALTLLAFLLGGR